MSIINSSSNIEAYIKDNIFYMKSRNLYGELGTGKVGNGTDIYISAKAFDSNKEKLYVTDTNIYLLKNKELYGTGSNFYNQISGNSLEKKITKFTPIITDVIKFYIYQESLFVVKSNKKLYSWGCNMYGLCGNGSRKYNVLPTILCNMHKTFVVSLYFGSNICVVVGKCSIMIWGRTRKKQVFIDDNLVHSFPDNVMYTTKPKLIKKYTNAKYEINIESNKVMISKK